MYDESYALQIELYERAGEGLKLSSEDQYDTALAYLAEGFCSRWPQHVQTAHKLLAELQKNSEAGKASTDLGTCSKASTGLDPSVTLLAATMCS